MIDVPMWWWIITAAWAVSEIIYNFREMGRDD